MAAGAGNFERRFLVSTVPESLRKLPKAELRLGLISQQKSAQVYLVLKGSARYMVARGVEVRLDRKQFDSLWPITDGRRIEVLRRETKIEGAVVHVNEFQGTLSGLAMLEATGSLDSNRLPPWVGPEVSNDPQFELASLAALTPETLGQDISSLLQKPARALGAIPFIALNNDYQVVIVTTKAKSRWIFPKGRPENGMGPEAVALMEAREEAGVEGKIVGSSLTIPYWSGYRCFDIEYFPVLVESLHTVWDEMSQRDRKVVPPDQARALLADSRFQSLVDEALKSLPSLPAKFRA